MQKIQTQEFQILVMVKQLYNQNVKNMAVKNQDLLKIKKEKDYQVTWVSKHH